MQFLWISLAVLALTGATVGHKHHKEAFKKCSEEFPNGSKAEMKKVWRGELNNAEDLNPDTQCLIKCMQEATGMLKDDKLQMPGGKKWEMTEEQKEGIEKCIAAPVKTCEDAARAIICGRGVVGAGAEEN